MDAKAGHLTTWKWLPIYVFLKNLYMLYIAIFQDNILEIFFKTSTGVENSMNKSSSLKIPFFSYINEMKNMWMKMKNEIYVKRTFDFVHEVL